MKIAFSIFKNSILVALIGFTCAWGVGYFYSGSPAGAYQALFLTMVLSILEISLSFDNAVVNATVLKKMTPLWQKRFLTWGIFIAVFVMRLVFPLLIVGVMAKINPLAALQMAAYRPDEYASIMLSTHVSIAAFGGAFLLLVALNYFFDESKEVHWIQLIEAPLIRLGRLKSLEVAITLVTIILFSKIQRPDETMNFLAWGVVGVITYVLVDGLGAFLQAPQEKSGPPTDMHKASIGMFLYLEVLDASFSFDGVVGAFAITNNLFLIMIGLGVGAMFVRSITVFLVEKGTLSELRYLEHGAFYAIGSLATIMFLGTLTHIPEYITGLLGALLIGLSLYSSLRFKNKMGL